MAGFYDLAAPFIRMLDPETAHRWTIRALASGWVRPSGAPPPPALATEALGLRFPSPLGLAAGFDKNAEVPDAMLAAGFGFVEIGTVTPRLQTGNPRPRMFRLATERAVINRLGFNNAGVDAATARLAHRDRGGGIVAGNVGPNRDSPDQVVDYEVCIAAVAPHVDILVLNASSPNTPGLRDLLGREAVTELLTRAIAARDRTGHRPPVLLKIAPDLEPGGMEAIVEAAVEGGAAGLVATNTTTGLRNGLRGRYSTEAGGLSGKPLLALSTQVLADAARLARGRLVLVGCGGVSSGADAYAKIRAGARLVELYTALAYEGPGLVQRIHHDLAALLARDGFARVDDAVGADVNT